MKEAFSGNIIDQKRGVVLATRSCRQSSRSHRDEISAPEERGRKPVISQLFLSIWWLLQKQQCADEAEKHPKTEKWGVKRPPMGPTNSVDFIIPY